MISLLLATRAGPPPPIGGKPAVPPPIATPAPTSAAEASAPAEANAPPARPTGDATAEPTTFADDGGTPAPTAKPFEGPPPIGVINEYSRESVACVDVGKKPITTKCECGKAYDWLKSQCKKDENGEPLKDDPNCFKHPERGKPVVEHKGFVESPLQCTIVNQKGEEKYQEYSHWSEGDHDCLKTKDCDPSYDIICKVPITHSPTAEPSAEPTAEPTEDAGAMALPQLGFAPPSYDEPSQAPTEATAASGLPQLGFAPPDYDEPSQAPTEATAAGGLPQLGFAPPDYDEPSQAPTAKSEGCPAGQTMVEPHTFVMVNKPCEGQDQVEVKTAEGCQEAWHKLAKKCDYKCLAKDRSKVIEHKNYPKTPYGCTIQNDKSADYADFPTFATGDGPDCHNDNSCRTDFTYVCKIKAGCKEDQQLPQLGFAPPDYDEPTQAPTDASGLPQLGFAPPDYDEPTGAPTAKAEAAAAMGLPSLGYAPPEYDEPTGAPTEDQLPSLGYAPPDGYDEPTSEPSHKPTKMPTAEPTPKPSTEPTKSPTHGPTDAPTPEPTVEPTEAPTADPTKSPTESPTEKPTQEPTDEPTESPTTKPTDTPTTAPTDEPTEEPTKTPTDAPTESPTVEPTESPTDAPTETPTEQPTEEPTLAPSNSPTFHDMKAQLGFTEGELATCEDDLEEAKSDLSDTEEELKDCQDKEATALPFSLMIKMVILTAMLGLAAYIFSECPTYMAGHKRPCQDTKPCGKKGVWSEDTLKQRLSTEEPDQKKSPRSSQK